MHVRTTSTITPLPVSGVEEDAAPKPPRKRTVRVRAFKPLVRKENEQAVKPLLPVYQRERDKLLVLNWIVKYIAQKSYCPSVDALFNKHTKRFSKAVGYTRVDKRALYEIVNTLREEGLIYVHEQFRTKGMHKPLLFWCLTDAGWAYIHTKPLEPLFSAIDEKRAMKYHALEIAREALELKRAGILKESE